MLRAFVIILAVVGALIGMSFVASRGGHETYNAQYFNPGPAIGVLRGLSEDALEGRGTGTPGAERAREIIEARMSALELLTLGPGYRHDFTIPSAQAGRVDEEGNPIEFEGPAEWSGVNLVGGIQGRTGSDRAIIVTAHYDHLGIVDGEIYNGADDNASGVAAALALAQHLTSRGNQPTHTFLFVFLDGEEHGLNGARAFVADPPIPAGSLAFNLNFDMMARADTGTLWASGPHHTPTLIPIIEEVSETAPFPFEIGFDGTDPAQEDWTELSDHGAFYAADIPHLYIGVDYHADYHRPTDDFENINQDMFLQLVDTGIMTALAIDENLEAILGLPPLAEPAE